MGRDDRARHVAGMTHPDSSLLPTRSLGFVLAAILAAFMLYLGINGMLNALAAAHGFGVDLAAPADAFYLHVKADRDLAIGAAFLALLLYRRPMPLALFTAACLVAPVIDCVLVAAHGRPLYALAIHGSAAVYGLITTYVLLRAARSPSTRASSASRGGSAAA
jgi:hypothetical protein